MMEAVEYEPPVMDERPSSNEMGSTDEVWATADEPCAAAHVHTSHSHSMAAHTMTRISFGGHEETAGQRKRSYGENCFSPHDVPPYSSSYSL